MTELFNFIKKETPSPDTEGFHSGAPDAGTLDSGGFGESAGASGPAIIDSDERGFEKDVLQESMVRPVIVDFWAPWCGPCKQLGPMLEKAVQAAGGAVRLVKIDIDKSRLLAGQLQIQSIPTVYAFFQGQPVDGFAGAQPESQIKAFVEQLVQIGGGNPAQAGMDAALAEAEARIEAGDTPHAAAILEALLEQDGDQIRARTSLASLMVGEGQLAAARRLIDEAPKHQNRDSDLLAVRARLEVKETAAQNAGDSGEEEQKLRTRLDKNPADHAARFRLAELLAGQERFEEAIGELLNLLAQDRHWSPASEQAENEQEDHARHTLLKYFEALGPTHPATLTGRRRLSSLLFA